MAQFASDAFSGTSGQTLQVYSASWVKHTSAGAREFKISAAGRAYADSGSGDACVYNTGTPASADYTVSADIVYVGASGANPGVCGRINTAASTYYHARYDTTSGGWQLYKRVAGTFTQLGSTASQAFTSGTKNILLSMVGTSIALYKEGGGSPTISATDSAITAAGYSGLRASTDLSSALHVDTFSADDVGGGNTIAVPAGALVLAGFAPSVSSTAHQTISVPAGTLTLSGFAPSVTSASNQTISVPVGALTLAAFAPVVTATENNSISVPAGSLTLAGFAPTVTSDANNTVAVPAGALTITGYAPTVSDGAASGFIRYFDVLSGRLLILRAL